MLSLVTSFAASYSYTTEASGSSNVSLGTLAAIYGVVLLATAVLMLAPLWIMYKRASRPGWAAIVPVYNSWVLFEIVGYPGWWALLLVVPFVNTFPTVMTILAMYKLAKLFGKSNAFAILTIFFPFICLPIIAYGNAPFEGGGTGGFDGPAAAPTGPVAPQPLATTQNVNVSNVVTGDVAPSAPQQSPVAPAPVVVPTTAPESPNYSDNSQNPPMTPPAPLS